MHLYHSKYFVYIIYDGKKFDEKNVKKTQYQIDFIWTTKSDATNLYEKVIAKVLYFGECNNSAIQNLDL